MKKLLFATLLLLGVTTLAQAQIVIDEIMFNPPEAGTDSLEYIEFYNNSTTNILLEGWTVDGVGYTFAAGSSIAANGYLVIAKSASAMHNVFNVTALQWNSSEALSNGGETIRIKKSDGTIVDEVTYDDMAPWPSGAVGNGYSIVLCDPAADNSVGTSWSDALTLVPNILINNKQVFANPGAPSGCVTGLVAQPDVASVVPDQPVIINVLANDNLPGGAASLTVTDAPQHGTAVVNNDYKIVYTPAAGYCGPDHFAYEVCEGPGACASAQVSVTVKCYPQRTIAQVTTENNALLGADSTGVSCQLTGTVYGVNIRSGGLQLVIMDPTGANGITLFRATGSLGYTVNQGDQVTVRGVITQFNGLTQMNLDTIFKTASNQPLVTAEVVTTLGENTENRLVRLNNLFLVDPIEWTPGVGSGFTVRVYSPDHVTDTLSLRIDNDVDLYNQATAPSGPFDLIGLGGQFDSSTPYSSGYQILPRYTADIFPTVGTKEADFSQFVRLSPNPANDVLYIQTSTSFQRIVLYNATGALVQTLIQPQASEQVSLSNLPTGVYFVRFEKDNAIWTTRVVKM